MRGEKRTRLQELVGEYESSVDRTKGINITGKDSWSIVVPPFALYTLSSLTS